MKSIGKYQVIEELDGSATGKTYRARDGFRNREFAVKVLKPVPGLGAQAKEQLCASLAACAELTHRHIAKVQDLGEVDEGIFVATEWRSGIDLWLFMRENQGMPLVQKLALLAQVAEGLAFAHSRGIAHGNLKPSNILVDGARDLFILDFGSAKWLAALLQSGANSEGLVASYLAPEQVLGQPFDARSDIFALGLMLYEFASGKYPFPADAGLIPREIVHSDPEPLGGVETQIPQEVEQLLARALQKNPERRLQTAEEFASELYVAAQQMRRMASLAAPTALPAVEQTAPVAAQPTTSEPMESQRPSPVAPAIEAPKAPPPVRQRPQDVELVPQPWTARSYASTPPLSSDGPISGIYLSRPPSVPAPASQPPSTPAPQARRSEQLTTPPLPAAAPSAPSQTPRSQRSSQFPPNQLPSNQLARPHLPGSPTTGKLKKRLLTAAAGLIVAAVIAGSLITRQSLRASQNRSHAVTEATAPSVPATKPPSLPAAVPAARTPKQAPSVPGEPANPEYSAKQILNGPVRALWESGKYAQALALINQVLAHDPADDGALAWRKKIREAQAAEAALK